MRHTVLAVVLVPPVVLFGGVHTNVQLGLLVTYSLLFTGILIRDHNRGRPLLWHPIVLAGSGFAVAALLQSVPLPIGWVEGLAPRTAEAVREIDAIFGVETTAAPLTLDRRATLAAAARWWMVSLGVLVVLQLYRRRRVRRATPILLLGLALFVLAVALAQSLAGVDEVYGLFEPMHANARPGAGGPFVGSNHCSHFLLLAGSVCLALMVEKERRANWLLVGLLALCVTGMLANGSRGALLALLIATLAFAATRWRHRRGSQPAAASIVATSLVVAFAVAALVALSSEPVKAFFELDTLRDQLDWSKLELQRVGWRVAYAFPWTGVGADAFGSIQMALVPMPDSRSHLSTVENDYLQLLIDFGFVIPLVIVALSVAVARRWPGRSRRRHRAMGWLIVLPFALYSLTSFALPVPALMLWVVAVFLATSGEWRPARGGRVAVTLVGLSVLFLAAFFYSALGADPKLPQGSERSELVERARSAPLDGRNVWSVAVKGMAQLNPAEVDALADRAVGLAGNDIGLLNALGRFLLQRRDPQRAWALFDRVLGLGGNPRLLVGDWIEDLDVADLLELCQAFPSQQAVILDALYQARRHADLLAVSLLLPDTPLALFNRIRASQRLGEPDLARGFAEQLAALPEEADPSQCRWRAQGLAAGGQLDAAMTSLAACIEQSPRTEPLLLLYLRWGLRNRASAEASSDLVDEYLARLNTLTAADPGARRRYYHVLLMAQARDGRCRAAALSLEMTRRPSGAVPQLPTWVREACPNLEGEDNTE